MPQNQNRKKAGPPGTHGPRHRMDPPEVFLQRPVRSSFFTEETLLWPVEPAAEKKQANICEDYINQASFQGLFLSSEIQTGIKNKCKLNTRGHLLRVSCAANVSRFKQKEARRIKITPAPVRCVESPGGLWCVGVCSITNFYHSIYFYNI